MKLINEEQFTHWKAQQKSGYGLAVFDYAVRWADLMEAELEKGAELDNIASSLSHQADVDGITGFQYGIAVQILRDFWPHGKELYDWHTEKRG